MMDGTDLIVSALKEWGVRLVSGSRWLTWDEIGREWLVFEHRRYARTNTTLYAGDDLAAAVRALIAE